MEEWTFHDITPVYAQLYDAVKLRILSGTYVPDSRLPSVRGIAEAAGVNSATVTRAFALLAKEKLIHRTRQGYMVTSDTAFIEATRHSEAKILAFTYVREITQLGFSVKEIMQEASYCTGKLLNSRSCKR